MPQRRIVVIGAGIGGLSAALVMAARGLDVLVLEQAAAPGGKLRQIRVGGAAIDAGPTVFTMRWVFDELFAAAGRSLDQHVRLMQAETLARHAWSESERLDLYQDIGRSTDAIGRFAGAREADGFRRFCVAARNTYEALEATFLRAERPSAVGLVGRLGIGGLRRFTHSNPMASLWQELGRYFADARLRQLFGRYATYVGSSPFEAPSTLMLIAHVEQQGVWLVEGGMHRLARALAEAIEASGGRIRLGTKVTEIAVAGGRASGVMLHGGERIEADGVVFNGDASALAGGLLGNGVRGAVHAEGGSRSLSAVTWAMRARCSGFALSRHNVFFSRDYEAEFAALFGAGRMPAVPTVYICAQDRDDTEAGSSATPESLLCLINAPALADRTASVHQWSDQQEIGRCLDTMNGRLRACGLTLTFEPEEAIPTTPGDFASLFDGSRGAIYGRASHGWMASFQRPGSRSRLPGLYLAGGSAHPGAGIPMAALSGRLAAASVLADLSSQLRFQAAAMPGGTSTGSATTVRTRSR